MTISTKEDYVTATNRFFSLFPLHLANVSRASINGCGDFKNTNILLHLFDLSHLNLETKRIFLIDLYDRRNGTDLFLRMAILDHYSRYQPVFIYVDDDYNSTESKNKLDVSKDIIKVLNFVENNILNTVKDLASKSNMTLNMFLDNATIYQSFLSLLGNNCINISQDNLANVGDYCINDCYTYPEIHIISPDGGFIYNQKRELSSNLFDVTCMSKSDANDLLSIFYNQILKCAFDKEIAIPNEYYTYSLNYTNYTKPYFIIDNSVYYCTFTNSGTFATRRLADDDILPNNFNDISPSKRDIAKYINIAFRNKYRFLAYRKKVEKILSDYEVQELNSLIAEFDYEKIKATLLNQIDLVAKILNERNEAIKAKIDSFYNIEVV